MTFDWLLAKQHKEDCYIPIPEEGQELEQEREPLQAYDDRDAQRKCEKIAAEYNGFEAKATHGKQNGQYDCRFWVWR